MGGSDRVGTSARPSLLLPPNQGKGSKSQPSLSQLEAPGPCEKHRPLKGRNTSMATGLCFTLSQSFRCLVQLDPFTW